MFNIETTDVMYLGCKKSLYDSTEFTFFHQSLDHPTLTVATTAFLLWLLWCWEKTCNFGVLHIA